MREVMSELGVSIIYLTVAAAFIGLLGYFIEVISSVGGA
jgi:hypothetical protein